MAGSTVGEVAEKAYEFADALLNARAKRYGEPAEA